MNENGRDVIFIGLWIVFAIIGVVSTIVFIARQLMPFVCS